MCSNPPKSDTFNLKEHFVEGNINLKFDYFSDGTILQAHLFGAAFGNLLRENTLVFPYFGRHPIFLIMFQQQYFV